MYDFCPLKGFKKGVKMEMTVKTLNKILGLILIILLVSAITTYKFDLPTPASKLGNFTTQKSYVSLSNVDRTLECLAINIYKEAGNEPFEGKVAVAQVTLNRVDNPKFPKDVCAVVYQKNVFMEKVVCQFSWYCDAAHKTRAVNKESYKESYAVAKKVLLEGFRLDSLNNALYYHAVYVNPKWPYEKITTIGNHIFYKGNV